MKCALCKNQPCLAEKENVPKNCPTERQTIALYQNEYGDLSKAAAKLTLRKDLSRIEEIVVFAKELGYKKIGLAFCKAMSSDAKIVHEYLENNGLQAISYMCKIGSIAYEELNMTHPSGFSLCNPIGQANLLNHAKTDLNIVLGLCLGHDSLFFKHSNAPATVLVVKDKKHGNALKL